MKHPYQCVATYVFIAGKPLEWVWKLQQVVIYAAVVSLQE
jgi:hypothetical protein